MDFGIDVNVGETIGIGGTGFGSVAADAAVGGLMEASIDAPNRDIVGLPITDERSVIEKAAGWAVNRVESKITNVLENPITAAINVAFSSVPVVGTFNSIMGTFGLPTVGHTLTALGRGIASGDYTPGTSFEMSEAEGESPPTDYGDTKPRVRYFRYSNGRIGSFYEPVKTQTSDPLVVSAETANYNGGW